MALLQYQRLAEPVAAGLLTDSVPPLPRVLGPAVIYQDYTWQYQASAARPLEHSLYATQGLDWLRQQPAPVRRIARPASLEASQLNPFQVPLAADLPLDWIVQQPTRPPPRRQAAHHMPFEKTVEPTLFEVPPLPFCSSQATVTRTFKWQYQAKADVPQPTSEIATVDKWFAETRQPIFSKVSVRPAPTTAITEPSLFLATTLDQWWKEAVSPVRRVPRAQPTIGAYIPEPTVFPENMVVTVDCWWRQPAEPVRKRPFVTHTPPVAITEPTLFTSQALAWIQPQSQPVLKRKPVTPSNIVFPTLVIVETITLDKWWKPASEPVRRRRKAVEMPGCFVIVVEAGGVVIHEDPRSIDLQLEIRRSLDMNLEIRRSLDENEER